MIANWNLRAIKAAVVVLTIALLLRVGWAMLIPVVPVSDSVAYDTFASMLATHGVYGWTPDQPTSYWPVGTSALYAAFYAVFGHNFTPVVVFNIILGTIIVGQTMWLTRLFFNSEVAIVAGSVMAIWPSQVAYVTILASELPFICFILLGFCVWYSPRLSTLGRGAASGVTFAAASYVRPVALLLPIIVWLTPMQNFRKLCEQLPVMLLAVIVIAACTAPWSVRNTKLYDHFVLLSTNGGANLWMGNNPASAGTYMPLPTSMEKLTEYEIDKQLGKAALGYITDHPLIFVFRTMKKAILLHLNETIAVDWNVEGIKQRLGGSSVLPLKLLMQGYWLLVLLLALAGIVALIRDHGVTTTLMHPIVATWIYFTAVYSLTVVQDRYHFPSQPFVAILSAVAIVSAMRRAQHGPIRTRSSTN